MLLACCHRTPLADLYQQRIICRTAIVDALGIGLTWLREIEDGHKLLRVHEGDARLRQRLEDTENRGGSKGMLDFLRCL